MTMHMNNEGDDKILSGINDSVALLKGAKFELHFDRIVVSQGAESGTIKVEFYKANTLAFTMGHQAVHFDRGESLTLTGIKGSMEGSLI